MGRCARFPFFLLWWVLCPRRLLRQATTPFSSALAGGYALSSCAGGLLRPCRRVGLRRIFSAFCERGLPRVAQKPFWRVFRWIVWHFFYLRIRYLTHNLVMWGRSRFTLPHCATQYRSPHRPSIKVVPHNPSPTCGDAGPHNPSPAHGGAGPHNPSPRLRPSWIFCREGRLAATVVTYRRSVPRTWRPANCPTAIPVRGESMRKVV